MRSSFFKGLLVFAAIGALSTVASGQGFLNAGFETGDFTDWDIGYTSNGTGGTELVEMYDIDGPGPLPTSYAARFNVGQVVFTSGVHEGVELTQDMTLNAGTTYTIKYNWSSWNNGTSANASGGKYHIIVNGAVQAEFDTGFISAGQQMYGVLSTTYTPAVTAVYEVGARITRPYLTPGTNLRQYVDLFEPVADSCHEPWFYNCDFETADFTDWRRQYTPNGTGGTELVELYDIDGPGPKGTTYAARFNVGQVVFTSGVHEGIELVQDLEMVAGETYRIAYDWSSFNNGTSANASGGKYQIIVDGVMQSEFDTGFISAGQQMYGVLTASYTPSVTRCYEVGARITRPYLTPGTNLRQYVDNFRPCGGPAPMVLSQTGGTCGSSRVALTVNNVIPGNRIALAYGFSDGFTPVPMCSGLSLDIARAKAAGVTIGFGTSVVFRGNVPSSVCPRIRTQAVDIDGCRKSNKLTGLM